MGKLQRLVNLLFDVTQAQAQNWSFTWHPLTFAPWCSNKSPLSR